MIAAETNVGNAERIGSVIVGAALIARAVTGPSLARLALAVGGLALLQRGLSGHCPLYQELGIAAARRRDRTPLNAVGDDPVVCASQDSFPASDPPSWTPVAGSVARHHPAPH